MIGAEDSRKRHHGSSDIVHTTDTHKFVAQRLQDLVSIVGGPAAFETNWLVNVDKDVLGVYQRLGERREID